jgi:two-component system OmpR family response regulator
MAAAAKVLVVDDEPPVLEVVAQILRDGGYEVLPASGPRQAFEIIRNQSPIDVVVSDVSMPEMRSTESDGSRTFLPGRRTSS